uniref:Uncharacterized protein n=2 Tax=unclassified bacterial viruses TaxID=12333 RepID=A0AAU6VYD6_9VIRU
MKEHEARMFGNILALEDDLLRFTARADVRVLLTCMRPHMRMEFEDGSEITWILMETYHDQNKIAGLEFTQMMFDISFPHDCLSYALSRVRGRII